MPDQPQQPPIPPILDYARAPKRGFLTTTAIIATIAIVISFVNHGLFMCGCGHQGMRAIPGHLLAATLAIWSFTRNAVN